MDGIVLCLLFIDFLIRQDAMFQQKLAMQEQILLQD